jgi:hypothetical protein
LLSAFGKMPANLFSSWRRLPVRMKLRKDISIDVLRLYPLFHFLYLLKVCHKSHKSTAASKLGYGRNTKKNWGLTLRSPFYAVTRSGWTGTVMSPSSYLYYRSYPTEILVCGNGSRDSKCSANFEQGSVKRGIGAKAKIWISSSVEA